MENEFFTKEEAEIIEKFVALGTSVGARAMAGGFKSDGAKALQYGAMLERLTIATREAERLFSLAAWRLGCPRSWKILEEHKRQMEEIEEQERREQQEIEERWRSDPTWN